MIVRVIWAVTTTPWLLLLMLGCAESPDEDAVARVGERTIRMQDLREFAAASPVLYQSQREGVAALRDYLQSMIDMELMLLEARTQGIHEETEVQQAYDRERRRRLVLEVERRFNDDHGLSEEELQRRWQETKWSRMLRLARIRVPSMAEAESVLERLRDGADFGAVAAQHSDDVSATAGGLLDGWYGRMNLSDLGISPDAAEALFDLQVGDVTAPTPYRGADGGFEIHKVVYEKPAPAYYREIFSREIGRTESREQRRALVRELALRYEVDVDSRAVEMLMRASGGQSPPRLELTEEEHAVELCRYRDGRLSVGDFVEAYHWRRLFGKVALDEEGVRDFTYEHLLPAALFYQLAIDEGLEEAPEVADWLLLRREALLIDQLRLREVEEKIDLSEDRLRRYVEEHPARFREPAIASVTEILVADEDLASDLLRRIRRGESMVSLAQEHSLRSSSQGTKGHLHVRPYQKGAYGDLVEAAMEAPAGNLMGPLAVPGGFSVFRVDERLPERGLSFEEAQRRAAYWVAAEDKERRFVELLEALRVRHGHLVTVFADRLVAEVASGEDG